ncbi:MAG: hypothetical protein ACK502_02250 [Alphaproteobacteria bacterium]
MSEKDTALKNKHVLIIGADNSAVSYGSNLEPEVERLIRVNEDIDWKNQNFAASIGRVVMTSDAQLDAIVVVNPDMQKQLAEGFNAQPLIKLASAIYGLKKPVIILDSGQITEPVRNFLSSIGVLYHNSDEVKPEQISSIVSGVIDEVSRTKGKNEGRA